MIEYVEQLIKCLNVQKKLYLDLLELSTKKRQMIIDNHIDFLDVLVEKERKLIDKINEEEEARRKFVDLIVGKKNISGQVTLTQIINLVDDEHKLILSNLLEDLNNVLRDLKRINIINNHLIKTQLNYIDMMKNLFIGSDQANYDINGKEVKGQTQTINIFDRMV